MALKQLIQETREAITTEGRMRWAGGTALPPTNRKGVLKTMSTRLKGMGAMHIVRMLDSKDWKKAMKEVTSMIADAERQGNDSNTAELRDMIKALRTMTEAAEYPPTMAAQFAEMLKKKFRSVSFDAKKNTGTANVGSAGRIEFYESSNDPTVRVTFTTPLEFTSDPAQMMKIVEAINKVFRMSG